VALAAAFILEKAQSGSGRALHAVLFGQDDDCGRADEAAVFLQRAEIERMLSIEAGKMPPDAPPGR